MLKRDKKTIDTPTSSAENFGMKNLLIGLVLVLHGEISAHKKITCGFGIAPLHFLHSLAM